MTILFSDPLFQRHETGRHPECPGRLVVIQNRLENAGLVTQCAKGAYAPLDETASGGGNGRQRAGLVWARME